MRAYKNYGRHFAVTVLATIEILYPLSDNRDLSAKKLVKLDCTNIVKFGGITD